MIGKSLMIRLVALDVYGVMEVPTSEGAEHDAWVIEVFRSFFDRTQRAQPPPAEIVDAARSVATELRDVVGPRSPVSLHPIFWRHVGGRLTGASLDGDNVDMLFKQACSARNRLMPIFPDVHSAVRELAGQCPLVVVSNGNSSRIRSLLEHAELSQYFEEILISGEWSYRKPDPEMMQWVMSRLGVSEPRNCVVIGDRLDTDVAGAATAGIRSILVARPEVGHQAIPNGPQPDAVVESLGAAATVVRDWCLGQKVG